MKRIRRIIKRHWILSDTITPAYGAIVMGSGIVSAGLFLNQQKTLSLFVLFFALLAWITLAALFVYRLVKQRGRIKKEAKILPALTGVAGTAVLGTNFVNNQVLILGLIFLGVAFILWIYVLPRVLQNLKKPTVGVSFLLTVSTEALANLMTAIYIVNRQEFFLFAGIVLFVLGLLFYIFVICSFDFREIFHGHGDHWVIGGALAISSLTIGKITLAIFLTESLKIYLQFFQFFAVALWAITMIWLPILLFAEVWNIRVAYDIRRWSTVFPLGMYAACSFSVGKDVVNVPIILQFAHYWVYIGLFAWSVGMIVMLKHDWLILYKE